MEYNVIQLQNKIAILVDDKEFSKAMKLYKNIFIRKLKVIDSRKHEFTFLKKDVLLFEKRFVDDKEE